MFSSISKHSWLHWLAYGLIGLALLAFVWYFVVYNIYAFSLFRFPFDYEQGEGFELMNVVWYSRGETPYRDTSPYPFFSTNYAPVFPLIILPLVMLFGPEYWTGRLIPYLGTLITAGAIGYAVQRESRRWCEQVVDYGQLSRKDFVRLLESQLALAKGENAKPADFNRTDEVLKEAKVHFDQSKKTEREEALKKYLAENESEDGFEFKPDELTLQFDALYRQIKDVKNHYFQDLEKSKDKNFASKTQLLQRLRELVENDESNTRNPGSSWQEFKKIQDEWKAAGNIASPHNSTLWATFHALIDRYYSNRNIYYELKELARSSSGALGGCCANPLISPSMRRQLISMSPRCVRIPPSPGVTAMHDLHVWAMSATRPALTAPLVRPEGTDDEFLVKLTDGISHTFGISHVTIQIERVQRDECEDC